MTSFIQWAKNPLKDASGNMSAFRLFLFIGLVIVLIGAWSVIFSFIRETVE